MRNDTAKANNCTTIAIDSGQISLDRGEGEREREGSSLSFDTRIICNFRICDSKFCILSIMPIIMGLGILVVQCKLETLSLRASIYMNIVIRLLIYFSDYVCVYVFEVHTIRPHHRMHSR